MQITSARYFILFYHVMSISIRHQSKQQLIFPRRTMKYNQMDTKRFADIVYSFDLVSTSSRIAQVCIHVFLDLFGHFNNF